MIRFIHAADLHLDTPFSGLEETSEYLAEKLRKATYQSFEKIVQTAIDQEVDFVLLAGDLYNTKRTNIRAQSLFIEQLKRLKENKIPVLLIHGNHDYITEETKNLTLPFPNNVYTFSSEIKTRIIKTKSKKRIAVSGFSYDSQWVFDRKVVSFPNRKNDVDMHIGLLHGELENEGAKNGSYAPFSLNEIRQKNYDYWALGHIHQRQKISEHPIAYYPGNIQGLHRNEMHEKGCLLIEWTPQEYQSRFIPTAPIIWDELSFNLEEIESVPMLIQSIKEKLLEQDYKQDVLIHFIFQIDEDVDEDLLNYIQENEFRNHLTEQINLENVWIASVDFMIDERVNQQSLAQLYPKEWEQSLNSIEERENFNKKTEQIFSQIPNRYLNRDNSKTYREEMIQKAIAKIHIKHQ